MKRLILSILILFNFIGCGNDFLGLEDYQRDILSILITQVGQESGSDGLNCWDISNDFVCDESEDWTGPDGGPDGVCDAWDCQGVTIVEGNVCTTLCHCRGDKCKALVVSVPAIDAHLNHGDFCGVCE